MKRRLILVLSAALMGTGLVRAQNEVDERALIEVKDGISISKDSLFLLNLRFRMQNRVGFTTVSGDDLSVGVADMRVRRLRLRFDGYVLRSAFQYYIQLNFSHSDLDLDAGGVAKPIRDAMLYYHVDRHLYFGLGQSKIPGNRQRVISSGNLQFPERSIANSAFTLDRDFGLFTYWTLPLQSDQQVQMKASITTGDGRSAVPGNSGLAYTGRVEWLPFGVFTNKGDYSEGDLEFEERPRLSLGVTISHNDRAYRTGGQLGQELFANRTFTTMIADAVLKYDGWALSAEYFDRRCDDPVTLGMGDAIRFVQTGQGFNVQGSKVFRSHYEFATRYTLVQPAANTEAFSRRTEEVLLGSSKYLNGHRIKLQAYIGYRWSSGQMAVDHPGNNWTTMFQVEFGI